MSSHVENTSSQFRPLSVSPPVEKENQEGKKGKDLQERSDVKTTNSMQKILNPYSHETPVIVESTSKERVEKAGKEFEGTQAEQAENTSHFFEDILSFLRAAFSYLNIFAYFKPFTETKETQQTEAPQPVTYQKATPQQLSQVAHRLALYFEENPEIFKTEGIFRLSANENEKKKLFNELLSLPTTDVLKKEDPHLIPGVLKQVYRMLNIFGENSEKFIETGLVLEAEKEPEEIVGKLKELVNTLPPERKEDLKIFIKILSQTSQDAATNKMTVQNLAVAAGPNLFNTTKLADIKPRQEVAAKLISHYQAVFEDQVL